MRGSTLRLALVCTALGTSSACAKLVGDFDFVAAGSASASGTGGATSASSSTSGTGGVIAAASTSGSTGGSGATASSASGTGGTMTASASGSGVGSTSTGSTPLCGNGVVEAGEECDDGNFSNTDACLNTCKKALCGDGWVEAGVEECDDGNTSNTDACLDTCKNARCGDGFVEAGVETCDDGNTTPGDRCGATCQKEDPGTCPGTPISLSAGQLVTINDTTTGASDKFVGSPAIGNCMMGNTWVGPDLIYAVTPATSGMLMASLTPSYAESFLHARAACPGGNQSDLDCHYGTTANTTETIKVNVTAGTTYYVGVDSYASTSGPFKLTLQLQ